MKQGRRKLRKYIPALASLCMMLLMAASLCGCGGGETSGGGDGQEPVSRDFFAMDTYMTVTAYGDKAGEATEAAEEEVYRLDAMFSTGNPDSEISGLNSKGGAVLSQEAGDLVERGLELYDETGKKFDIAVYPVMKAWGFTDKKYRVPSEEELEKLLPLTDAAEVHCADSDDSDGVEVSFGKEGMAIDLGGIAKGYTSARIMEVYKEHGVTSGLVSLGGNVQVLGTKPDGSKWKVAVQDPGSKTEDDADAADGSGETGAAEYMGMLEVADAAVITSGAYERNFTQGGKFYHHIIDPATGYPADSGLKSVTIVSQDGTLADALATSLYIMGKDDALDYWRDHRDEFGCILMDDDGELYVTEDIAGDFSSDAYHVTVVE